MGLFSKKEADRWILSWDDTIGLMHSGRACSVHKTLIEAKSAAVEKQGSCPAIYRVAQHFDVIISADVQAREG